MCRVSFPSCFSSYCYFTCLPITLVLALPLTLSHTQCDGPYFLFTFTFLGIIHTVHCCESIHGGRVHLHGTCVPYRVRYSLHRIDEDMKYVLLPEFSCVVFAFAHSACELYAFVLNCITSSSSLFPYSPPPPHTHSLFSPPSILNAVSLGSTFQMQSGLLEF